MSLPVVAGVKRGKHVDDPPLHPHVFVVIVNGTVAIQTGEKAAVFAVLRMIQPERDDTFQQLFFVAFDVRVPVHFLSSPPVEAVVFRTISGA